MLFSKPRPNTPSTTNRKFWFGLWLLAGLAFALRMLNARSIHQALGTAQILDSAYYHDVARAMLTGRTIPGLEGDTAFANLGYPYVLRWLYAVWPSPETALVFQALVGAATAMITGLAARDLFRRRLVALWATGLGAVYAPSIFYDGLLLTPCLSVFLAAVLLWSLGQAIRLRSWRWGVLAGLSIGAAALLRASQWLLLPLALLALHGLRRDRHGAWPWRKLALALLLATATCTAPVVLWQRLVSQSWIPLTSNGGINFWIGNHRGATGTTMDAPFLGTSMGGDFQHTIVVERNKYLEEARRRSGNPQLSLAQASGFWWRQAGGEIAAAPGQWLGVFMRKLWFAANNYEPRTNASMDLMEELSPPLSWNPFRFGGLLVLATFGAMQLSRLKHRRARWLSAVLVLAPWLTCVVFFVSGEYRHPATPALMVLAAFGLHRITQAVRDGIALRWFTPWPRALAMGGVLLLAFAPVKHIGPAKDRKAYAEALASPGADGRPPTLERYALARGLLQRHVDCAEDQILSNEAMLLVESNQAIQFRDEAAADRLIQAAQALWKHDLRPVASMDVPTIERVRRNSVRRIAQLCRQPFVGNWKRIERKLALLGCHSWAEARFFLDRGMLDEAQVFLQASHRLAPYAVEVLAYLGQLEGLRGKDAMPWFQKSMNAYPRLALPALLMAEDALAKSDRSNAGRYAEEALVREPSSRQAREFLARLAGLQGQAQ